jgi:ABC-type sugar transport system permease subunit
MAVRRTTLAQREARLAYLLLTPTFAVVLLIVLIPVLLTIWLSFKPVTLADLRAPAPVANERVVTAADAVGDELVLRLTMRNGSQRVELRGVAWEKTLPPGLTLVRDDPRCDQAGAAVRCSFGTWEAGYRETLDLAFRADAAYLAAGSPDVRAAPTRMQGRAENVLTSLVFTLDNYRRILTGAEFWPTLRITLAYTTFSSIGSILLGLFAAMLLNGSFRGQGILRGLFLFPYVAPVIAVAFVWAFFLDPFSGTVNALGQRWDLLAGPVNFLGQRSIEIGLAGLRFELPAGAHDRHRVQLLELFPLRLPVHPRAPAGGAGRDVRGRRRRRRGTVREVLVHHAAEPRRRPGRAVPAAVHVPDQQVRGHLPAHRRGRRHQEPARDGVRRGLRAGRHRRGLGRRHHLVRGPARLHGGLLPLRPGDGAMSAPPVRPKPSAAGVLLAALVGAPTTAIVVAGWALVATLVGGMVTTLPLGLGLLLGLVLGAVIGAWRDHRGTSSRRGGRHGLRSRCCGWPSPACARWDWRRSGPCGGSAPPWHPSAWPATSCATRCAASTSVASTATRSSGCSSGCCAGSASPSSWASSSSRSGTCSPPASRTAPRCCATRPA